MPSVFHTGIYQSHIYNNASCSSYVLCQHLWYIFRLYWLISYSEDSMTQPHRFITGPMASQITSLAIVYSTVYSRRKSKKTSKLCVTGLCAGNSPVTGQFPAQIATNTENVSIWWRHHVPVSYNLSRNPFDWQQSYFKGRADASICLLE